MTIHRIDSYRASSSFSFQLLSSQMSLAVAMPAREGNSWGIREWEEMVLGICWNFRGAEISLVLELN